MIRPDKSIDPHRFAEYDAVIIVGTISQAAIKTIKAVNPNLVVVDSGSYDHDQIDIVDTNLAELTTHALDEMGRISQSIAFIGGNRHEVDIDGKSGVIVEDARTGAYKKWCQDNNRTPIIKLTDWTAKQSMDATDALLGQYGHKIDGLIVASDPLSIGVMKGLAKHNVVPGKDLKLISYDDSRVCVLSNTVIDEHLAAESRIRLCGRPACRNTCQFPAKLAYPKHHSRKIPLPETFQSPDYFLPIPSLSCCGTIIRFQIAFKMMYPKITPTSALKKKLGINRYTAPVVPISHCAIG